MELREWRARLDGELVEREVVTRHRQRVRQLPLPVVQCLTGPRIDEVEREAGERLTRYLDRGLRLSGSVEAAEIAQVGVVEGLHAERDAVDPRGAVVAKPRRLDGGRIGLQRDLGARIQGPEAADLVQQGMDGGCRHERRRAAAEEDAAYPAAGCQVCPMPQLAEIGARKPRLVDAAGAHVAIEVAVRALGGAERPMDVDAKGCI